MGKNATGRSPFKRDRLRQRGAAPDFQKTGTADRRARNGEMPFPHELGLLLGYPAEDVRGFMGIGYKKCLYTGYWKVYEKAEEKIALFSEYDRAMDLALSMAYERQNILKLKEVFEVDSREKKLAV